MTTYNVTFEFDVKYKYPNEHPKYNPDKDFAGNVDNDFILEYFIYDENGNEVDFGKNYYESTTTNLFKFSKEMNTKESIEIIIKSISNIYKDDSVKYITPASVMEVENSIEHTFVLTRITDISDELYRKLGKEVSEKILKTDYGRTFGNNDVLIIWHDGKVMNLKTVEKISSTFESEITEKNIDKSRRNDKSYLRNKLNSVELELEIGDVWEKNGSEGTFKKQNRNSVLRTFHNLYSNNIPINFRSNVKIIDVGFISDYKVVQTSDSDNTYKLECTIKEVELIKSLPGVLIVEEGEGYTEKEINDTIKVKLSESEKDEDDSGGGKGKWEQFKDFCWVEEDEFPDEWPSLPGDEEEYAY